MRDGTLCGSLVKAKRDDGEPCQFFARFERLVDFIRDVYNAEICIVVHEVVITRSVLLVLAARLVVGKDSYIFFAVSIAVDITRVHQREF